MSELKGFLRKDIGTADDLVEYKVSSRFTVPFKLKAISSAVDAGLRSKCTKSTAVRSGINKEFDSERYSLLMVAESIVVPNLKDVALQNEWEVVGEERLLQAMVSKPGEYMNLLLKVQEVNGFSSMEEDIQTSKN